MAYKIVKSSELGTNCWLPARFCDGVRCDRVYRCTYPEKSTCKAVDAELEYEQKHAAEVIAETAARTTAYIAKLKQAKDIKVSKLKSGG